MRREAAFGNGKVQEVFGMAEGLLFYPRLDDPSDIRIETVGRPLCPDDELRLVDDDGHGVPAGEIGELLCRGPYTLRCYYRAPEHNTRAFTPDGFFRTGDLMRLHPSGNYVVEGRKKDVVNRAGEKIGTEEVENLILQLPEVGNVACVPMPDPVLGERMCAFVIPRPDGTVTLADISAHLTAQGLGKYKHPERVELVDEFPISSFGKVQKNVLAQRISEIPRAGEGELGMRIIDLHCYTGTAPWTEAQQPFAEALGRYWGHPWTPKTEAEVADDFRAAGVDAVLVAFDIESAAGTPPCSNEYVARMRDAHADVIIQAWAAVDPFKGDLAIAQAETAIRELKMLGFHFHPIMGRVAVDDRRLYPLWETINALGVPVMIDVGTTGMGAGMPGGSGTRIRFAHPTAADGLAADFPDLTIVMAHPGWPWVEETIAVALHKGNVFWELSGWAPRYFPEPVKREIRGRLRDKVMFGSDYPSLPYERVLREWAELGYSDAVLEQVFQGNAERILGL